MSAPRATVAAVILLAVAMFGFGILAEAERGEAEAVATRDAPTGKRTGPLDVFSLCPAKLADRHTKEQHEPT